IPRALIEGSSFGSRGAVYDTPPAKLNIYDTVTLTGLALTGSTESDPDGAPATDATEPMVPEGQAALPPRPAPAANPPAPSRANTMPQAAPSASNRNAAPSPPVEPQANRNVAPRPSRR